MIAKEYWSILLLGVLTIWGGGCSKSSTYSSQPPPQGTTHHYEYVLTAGFIYVYDIDNAGALVKTLMVPTTAGVRGAVASVATGKLYIAFGGDGGGHGNGSQLAYDLATDSVVWTKNYSHGIDSQAITPDGKKIFMPSGEVSCDSNWYVEDPATGNDMSTIQASNTGCGTGTGPHNTIVNPSGTKVYMGLRDLNLGGGNGQNDFAVASASTGQVLLHVSPTQSGVRPFIVNSKDTLVYFAVTGFIGFQVGDLTSGNVLHTTAVDGSAIPGYTTSSSVTCPSHGIALSSDDSTLYLIDQPNSYVHVFDVSKVPASPPVQIANIPLPDKFSGSQSECAYDCEKDGWLHLSHDGQFLFVGDTPDVISTGTKALAMKMPKIADSRIEIEIDFNGTTPVWAMGQRSN
jgi:DNA-binding beta-propeller fold protein YncE